MYMYARGGQSIARNGTCIHTCMHARALQVTVFRCARETHNRKPTKGKESKREEERYW